MKFKNCAFGIFLLLLIIIMLASGENFKENLTIYEVFHQEHDESDPRELIYRTLHEKLVSKSDGNGTCDIFKRFMKEGYQAQPNSDLLWIIEMLDSWSKIPSGILTGNIMDNGQFDECFDLEASANGKTIKGQYCGRAVNIRLLKLPVSLSICLPDSCELQNFMSADINITNILCQTKGTFSEFDWDDWAVTGVFIAILAIILVSTIYDSFLYLTKAKSSSQLLIAFSLLTNGRKLFAVTNSSAQVGCLNGIRAISLMWIIAGHRFITSRGIPHINTFESLEWKDDIASSYISSARAAVDTFFILSAFLVSYNYFKGLQSAIAKAEAKGSSNVQNPLTISKIPMFYIHRILRVTPALAAIFFVYLTLLRRIGDGPLWPIAIGINRASCTEWWWTLFLYVQNYVNYDDICIVPTWYLSVDMQLYLLSPLLIIPLGNLVIKGKKKTAYILLSVLIFLGMIIPMIIDFIRDFNPLNIYETHTRISVYIIGIFFGMIIIEYKNKKININYAVNILLWALSLGVMIGIVVSMHTTESYPEAVKNNLFFTFTRPLWCIALCWIIFACHFGYGGPVDWLLSKSIFQIMTRLSYSMYLLHNMVNTVNMASARTTIHFSEYELIYTWCGDYIFTILLSIVWVLCFESPAVAIEKIIFAPSESFGTFFWSRPPASGRRNDPFFCYGILIPLYTFCTVSRDRANGRFKSGGTVFTYLVFTFDVIDEMLVKL